MAWDITAATYVSTKGVSAQDNTPRGVAFSGDGTKMFVMGYSNKSVYRYDLSTGWDITTASYVTSKSVYAQAVGPLDVTFSGDGTTMFVVDTNSDSVYRYDLSTAWDITTASYVTSKSVYAQDANPFGVALSGDGTKMFVIGLDSDSVHRYDLGTAWDITTASYVSLKYVGSQDTGPVGVAFSGDGTKMFVIGSSNESVYRYDLATPPATVAGNPAAASSSSDAEATAGSLVVSGTPADATSATDAATTAEDFSTATPAERIHTIPGESRLTTIDAENRVTTIAAENRTTGALPG